MAVSYYSIVTYLSDGGDDIVLTVPFPYLRKEDIFVYKDGTLLPRNSGWDYLTEDQVHVIGHTVAGTKFTVRRITRKDARLAEYFNGATLTEDDLNIVTKQLLFLIQEMFDYLTAHDSGNPPPGGPGSNDGDGSGSTGDLIDQIIAELLNSQLFKDLTDLIPLMDINGESILANILKDHDAWSQGRTFNDLIAKNDAGLKEVDARVTHRIDTLIDSTSATASELDALQVRYNGTEADFIEFKIVSASADSALAEDITVLDLRMSTGESRIGTIEAVKIDATQASALIQTQIDSRFTQSATDAFINASSYINAIRTVNNAQGSTMQGITSYIAGSGVTIDSNGNITWPLTPGGLTASIAGVQQTIDVNASSWNAAAGLRNVLASKFLPADPNNTTAMVAAMENSWKTYADAGSATATRVSTLEVNRQPIFFRQNDPNPYAAEFGTTYVQPKGFPVGSIWYRQVGSKLYPYYWWNTTTAPAGSDSTYGPYSNPVYGTVPGLWASLKDDKIGDVLGARIDQVASTIITSTMVQAQIQDTLTTVFNQGSWSGVNTIASRLTSLVNPSTGLMYSSWNVRINQYLGTNAPVIAGVGLGMQSDPNNPQRGARSQFIVMADQFGVIKPPAVDPMGGPVDLNTVVVPFVIDTATGTVGVNGKLMVKGSLSAYDGAMGRVIATELNADSSVKFKDGIGNPNGPRIMLTSQFNNFNASNAASPFTGTNPQRYWIWAGNGTMNHNNATFYVDTEGNGFFNGVVSADNVNGQFNDALAVDKTFTTTVPSNSTYVLLPAGAVELDSRAGRDRIPFAMISVLVNGVSGDKNITGNLKMEMDYETSPSVWANDWRIVATSALYQAGGQTVVLAGGLPFQVKYKARIRIWVNFTPPNGDSWQHPSVSTFSGLFIGLR